LRSIEFNLGLGLVFLLIGGVVGGILRPESKAFKWGYASCENGPSVWGEHYPECKKFSQSPIALPTVFADMPLLSRIEYHDFNLDCDLELVNDGKTVSVVVKDTTAKRPSFSGSLFDEKERYLLDRAVIRVGHHDCCGSEHGMNGIMYAGEMQWFYYDSQFKSFEEAVKTPGSVAIISQLLEADKNDNKNLDYIIDNLHRINGSRKAVDLKWTSTPEFLPAFKGDSYKKKCVNCDFYFYEGSLSYPPCSEVALWHVYMEPLKISGAQLVALRHVLSCDTMKPMNMNHRNIQPLNFRDVLQHREKSIEDYNLPPRPAPQAYPPPMQGVYPPMMGPDDAMYPPMMGSGDVMYPPMMPTYMQNLPPYMQDSISGGKQDDVLPELLDQDSTASAGSNQNNMYPNRNPGRYPQGPPPPGFYPPQHPGQGRFPPNHQQGMYPPQPQHGHGPRDEKLFWPFPFNLNSGGEEGNMGMLNFQFGMNGEGNKQAGSAPAEEEEKKK
jgi:carbonic anhydrase